MGVLDQVMYLKNQGVSEDEIIRNLQQQGISPKIISDALGQADVKRAISSSEDPMTEEMQPSILQEESEAVPSSQDQPLETYQPQQLTREISSPQQYSPQEYIPQEQYYQPQEQYQDYSSQPQYSGGGYGFDTDTIIEISEQVFSEKIKILQEQISSMNEFKVITNAKIENIAARLKRIEAIIDKLEIAILGKIGSYAGSIDSIKKEMSMMQDSFSKMIGSSVRKFPYKK
ncbi:MAG: hypothetical protein AABX30_03685 [Nanoarchaeota archaeon]